MDKLAEKVNALISAIAEGDKSALGKLYGLTAGYLCFMARKYLADKSYAEDVVSEVFLRVVQSAYTFNQNYNGLNWLFKITKNTALNFNSRTSRFSYEDIDAHRDIADVFSPGDGDELAHIRYKLRALPEDERELLYYRYWEGYTVRELAGRLGKPVMSVYDKLKKILKKLKNEL